MLYKLFLQKMRGPIQDRSHTPVMYVKRRTQKLGIHLDTLRSILLRRYTPVNYARNIITTMQTWLQIFFHIISSTFL